MAHSVQEFEGRAAVLNDLDLVALVAVLSQIPVANALQERLTLGFRTALAIAGPGTIDLKLNEFVRSIDDRREVGRLLLRIREVASQAGETLPREWSENIPTGFGAVLASHYPPHLVSDTVQQLEFLIFERSRQ